MRTQRPLRTELSNWEAIELYQRYKSGTPLGTLQFDYHMSGTSVRKIIGAIEKKARDMGLAANV